MESRLWSDHLTAPVSGESGLLELLREASDLYQVEVVNQNKLYQRFAEDFVLSHEFHDALDAKSRNEHQKNFHILKSLLLNRRDLVEQFFSKEERSDDELCQMLHLFNTTLPSSANQAHSQTGGAENSLSLRSCLNLEDCEILVRACNDAHLFRDGIKATDLLSLLQGNLDFPLRSINNRLVAYFFQQLFLYGFITEYWQNAIAKMHCIDSSTGRGSITSKALSSALYQVNENEPTSEARIIENAVRALSLKYQENSKSAKQLPR